MPALVVSDNLKSGVIRACFYEPEINRSYADMATHYGTAILPARPYKPRDKAKSLPRTPIRGRRRSPAGAALDRRAAAQPAVFLP